MEREERPAGRPARGARAEKARPDGDPEVFAREVCLRLLTGAPRTRAQLARALARRDVPGEVAERVLGRFADAGLVDDAAFAAAWVESRHEGRGLGRRALASELRSRGVAADVTEAAVGRLTGDQERRTARALVDRRLRTMGDLAPAARTRRLAGALARRGYPAGIAAQVIREALSDADLDIGGVELAELDEE